MKPQKISLVIDCRMIIVSGVGTYIQNILPGIIESKKFIVTVMGTEDVLNKFPWFSATTFIKLKSKILSVGEQFELALKIPKCDLYWSPHINGTIFSTKARRRISTIHDVYHLAHRSQFSLPSIWYIKLLVDASIRHSATIITVSHFSKTEISKYTGCAPEKINVILEAVADNFSKDFIFSKIQEPYILFVGNVKPHKNLGIALKAFKKLEIPGLKFYIVGKKNGFFTEDTSIREIVEKLGDRVFFTGHVDDSSLKNYYANASLFLFPSKYEGFGLPVLEAMKFNLPILASHSAAIPEVGGEVIEYFNPLLLEELVSKMRIMLNKTESPNAKYEAHLKNFSWQKSVNQHIEVFERFILHA